MAERSFATEVQELRLGAGEEFRGEGILAVTKGLLQSGVAYVGGYQGAPISHLMDVLGDAQDILDELGVYFENSASEATAAASLAASVHYPLRGAITFQSTVGFNVASDALANLSSGGVLGGALHPRSKRWLGIHQSLLANAPPDFGQAPSTATRGQSKASTQPEQRGLVALQTWRPCLIS